eukprot:scaffold249334_cov83-Cyclotella_meneghiniana.AAC.4
MNDPSSAFLAAAFAAGIVEGSSIIRHYRKIFNAPSSINVAAHSVLYGMISLPLGIIGASPGMAFYPKALKLCIDAVEVHQVQEKHDVSARVLEDASRESEMQKTNITSTASPHVTGTGRGIGRMLREENLKKIHSHTHQVEQVGPATHHQLQSSLSQPSSSSGLSRYVSTLDGCVLPTLVSEAMRRSRSLFVGAALVSIGITKFISSSTTSGRQTNEHIAESIVNESGEVDYNHGAKLQERLRADMEVAAASSESDLPSNKISYAYKQVKADVLNTLSKAVMKIEEQLVNESEDSPLKVLSNWKETTSSSNSRPIALRLVLNKENEMPFVSSNRKSLFPWLTTETENNSRNHLRQNNPFFVLPINYSDSKGLGFNRNKYNPWWKFDDKEKSLNELPINPSWLLKTINTNPALANKLITEANICPSIHQLLQHRYPDKRPSQNSDETQPLHEVNMILRMMDKLARSKCPDSPNISSSTIMICDKERTAMIPTNSLCLDGLDVLRWSIISTINKMRTIDDKTPSVPVPSPEADKDDSATIGVHITTRSTKYATGKETSSPWSVIDVTTVIGTSIRHLLQSTYRIASAIFFLVGRPHKPRISTTKVISEISKEITIISPYESTSAWLATSLRSYGWKTKALNPNQDTTIIGGIVLVLGKNDFETCEIARSLIEQTEFGTKKDSDRQLLLLLDNSQYEMLNDFNSKIGSEKATILCTDCIYELAFAIARSGLSRGMSSEEVQVELENSFLVGN